MKPVRRSEMPPERLRILRRAIVLEWVTIAFLVSVSILMYIVMGSSQAMKTAWVEDLLSLVPPIVFLISVKLQDWQPNERYPYGYHRGVNLAFLVASLALFGVGAFLLTESIIKLVKAEHPTIGSVDWFGEPIWLGWLMLPVLLWSVVPAVLLGRAKIQPARQLHDKTLFADASMNKADWLTGVAAMVGVMGIAVGWWWADAAAAALISLDVLHDGFKHLRAVTGDLMDRAPRTVDDRMAEALPERLATELSGLPWVRDVKVRLREDGHVFFGEAFITPEDQRQLVARTQEALELAYGLDWRLQELVIQIGPPQNGDEPAE